MGSKSCAGDVQRDEQRDNGGGTRYRDRAIMGGSIAGLAAARVLSRHYGEVILVERDRFGEVGEHRRGVPQGRHAHGLLASGLNTLEGLFPGLFQEAINAGGLRIDVMRDSHWWFEGGEHARFESGLEALSITRPLLEGIIRERVRRIPNVRFSDECQVHGLIGTPDNSRVTGIKTSGGTLLADLVVDATGRGSLSPIWLEEIGYDPPKRERIEINVAYTTRRFAGLPMI